jgi:predicted AlkP superfamily pyrophosphatase or phosphodiesterase
MKKTKFLALLASIVSLTCGNCGVENTFAATALRPRPKLIVMIVIDQFRADYLMRFENRFAPDGFRELMSEGAYYPYGEYGLLQSMTGPGHATVLTGAYPYQHGIPANAWFDQETQAAVYCVEDASSPLIQSDKSAGRSPKNLMASTVGDELKNAGYGSRVYSVALKDRAAILMGGHRPDLAIWFDPVRAQWISSRYYLPSGVLPAWLAELNAVVVKPHGNWRPEGAGTGYSTEVAPFTHRVEAFTERALHSPYGDELTEQAAEAVYDKMQLGRGKAPTDLLAVSFSSHDLVGHEFGPNSREMEEMTVSEDREIAKLLNHIRASMPGGLDHVVIALTADHGIPAMPEYALEAHMPAGRLNDKDLERIVEEKLATRFGKAPRGKKWVDFSADLSLKLDRETIAEKKIKLEDALAVAQAALEKHTGVLYVATQNGKPPGLFGMQYEHTYFPGRASDLIIIPQPNYMSAGDNVAHHTGYAYDRTVPIILMGPQFFKPGVYAQSARVIDIAPTLSFISGTIPPNMSEGRVLSESLFTR